MFCCAAAPEYAFVQERFGYPPEAVQHVGFCRFDALCGFENALCNLIAEPEESYALMSAIADADRDMKIKESLLYSKYCNAVDPDSAYEFLQRRGLELQAEAEEAAAAAEAAKEAEKAAKEEAKQAEKEAKEAEKEAQKAKKARARAAKSVGNSVVGTVGREVGKSLGGKFGKFGKTLGGNLGASLGRGLLSTLFKS